MNSPSAKQPDETPAPTPVPEVVVPSEKPVVGERAAQFADDALRYVRLTKNAIVVQPDPEKAAGPVGAVADAIAARASLIALAVKYNISGSELVDAARMLAWRLKEGQ